MMKKYCTKLLAMTFLLVLSGILTGCSSAKGTDASDENQSETIAANVIAVPNEEVNSTDEASDKLKLAVSLPSALSGWDADVIYYAEQRARELALENGWSFEVSGGCKCRRTVCPIAGMGSGVQCCGACYLPVGLPESDRFG